MTESSGEGDSVGRGAGTELRNRPPREWTESRKKLPREWASAVMQLLEHEPAAVRIVVAQVRGSAPREPGAFMLVGREGVQGTIGGGRLEWESIAAARELLGDRSTAARLNTVVLGPDLGQCCGGVVAIWLERFTREDVGFLRLVREAGVRGRAVLSSTVKGASVERHFVCATGSRRDASGAHLPRGADAAGGPPVSSSVDAGLAADEANALLGEPRGVARPRVVREVAGAVTLLERLDDEFPGLWLYGAGHVGQALARILAELPLRLTWIDSRAELFPSVTPDGVRIRRDADSRATVPDAPPGTYFLVMTHSHPLDFSLCQAILERKDFAWLGLIGSDSKAARFRSRLRRTGVPPETLARLVCPIGVAGIESKWPTAIAVGVAAQVMQQISSAAALDCKDVGHDEGADRPTARLQSGDADSKVNCDGEGCSTCGTVAAAIPDADSILRVSRPSERAGGMGRAGAGTRAGEATAQGRGASTRAGETAAQAGAPGAPVVGPS
jgi:xanthine dehydrogenase accessory factor